MRIMKTNICLITIFAIATLQVVAGIYPSGNLLGTTIPDNNATGTADTLNYTPSPVIDPGGNGIVYITGLNLSFSLQHGSSSDLSGYLRLGNSMGAPSYDLTSLIHTQTLNEDAPTSYSIDFNTIGFKDAFNGLDPNNVWTLFFADTVNGDTSIVNGWSLNITAVPEPINMALGIFGGTAGLIVLGRAVWRKKAQATDLA